MPTELHKATVSLIHQGYRNLELVDTLKRKFDILGDEAERELEKTVNALRKRIAEARACAQEVAEEAFRQGKTWKETIVILERPALLASYEVITYAHRAYDKVFGTSQQ